MSWAQIETFKRDKDGKVYINPAKDFIFPYELPIDKPNGIITLAPGAEVGPFPMSAKADGPIEIFFMKAVVYDNDDVPVTDYDIDFQLSHPGKRKIFSNRIVPLIAAAGDGGRPGVLAESIFLPQVQALNVFFKNNDLVNTRKVEFVLGGMKIYPNAAPQEIRGELWDYIQRRERTYCYWQTTDAPIALAAADLGVPGFYTMPDDTDMEIFKLTAKSDGMFRAELKDGQTDRGLTGGQRIHSSLLFGGHQAVAMGGGVGGSGGLFPARWATSWLIRRSVKGEVLFDNLSGAPNNVKIILAGRKVAYAS
jgi:hypothetical protein